jgi:glycerophosphoryl diester phosphodiesterase
VSVSRVWFQSFNEPDIMYWIRNEPAFGAQAVMLDGNETFGGLRPQLTRLYAAGVRYVAPPIGQLIASSANGTGLVQSGYARDAIAAGLKVITWTVERNYECWPAEASTLATPQCKSMNELELIDTLYKMGVVGVFSDWPATTTFYASCMIAKREYAQPETASIDARPAWLVNNMAPSPLKTTLSTCLADASFVPKPHDFSIGHRGACLQFPEHTAESYTAAIEMGAGIVECDVSVTKDGELVCRHDQCDLHTSTNILAVPSLAAKCSIPFTPGYPANATHNATSARVSCCTSDLTLAEFKTLCGRMDSSKASATSAAAYMSMDNTATFRTDLYSDAWDGTVCPTLVTHKESIALINAAGRKFTPELKTYFSWSGSLTYDQVRQKVQAAGARERRPCHSNCF